MAEAPRTWHDVLFTLLEMLALAFAFVGAERLADGKSLTSVGLVWTTSILFFLAGSLFGEALWPKIKRGRSRLSLAGIVCLSGFVVVGVVWWTNSHRAGFVIRYQNAVLDKQTVTLSPITDRTPRQTRMFFEPRMFVVTGVSIRNDGDLPLQPSAISLSFDAPVEKFQPNAGTWEPCTDPSGAGWVTFTAAVYRGPIEPEHSRGIEDFYGVPVVAKPVRARITVSYGLKETKAEFTIMPP